MCARNRVAGSHWQIILLTFLSVSGPAIGGDALEVIQAPPMHDRSIDYFREGALVQINEVSSRRRLTVLFPNEQTSFYGVQISYVNTSRGNLTFMQRDLVRQDRLPAVLGRIHDSSIKDGTDFGPGWKLSFAERIIRTRSNLEYTDANNNHHLLRVEGTEAHQEFPQYTDIDAVRLDGDRISIYSGNLVKHFMRIGEEYLLTHVMSIDGSRLDLTYDAGRVSGVRGSGGRWIRLQRDSDGRIVAATDDRGKTVRYSYDRQGRLILARDAAGREFEYRYHARDLLAVVRDSAGKPLLRSTFYNDRRVKNVKVQHEKLRLSYDTDSTRIENADGRTATVWHNQQGLTIASQDYEGIVSQLLFDDQLHLQSLLMNNELVLQIGRDNYGRPTKLIRRLSDGRLMAETIQYNSMGLPIRVAAGDQTLAEYEYDEDGRISRASDSSGARSYRYSDRGDIVEFASATDAHAYTVDELGRVIRVNQSGSTLSLEYDSEDLVASTLVQVPAIEIRASYQYGENGFRERATYVAENSLGRESIDVQISYDKAGNATGYRFVSGDGREQFDKYEIGQNNELTKIVSSYDAPTIYSYDDSGRPIGIQRGPQEMQIVYDVLGRTTEVSLNDEVMLTEHYGPMDLDIATEHDDRTSQTYVPAPIVSSVYGRLEEIVYTRSAGTPFDPVRFHSRMARFVVDDDRVALPDATQYASLERRQLTLPLDELVLMPLAGFDRASSSIFIPPEYFRTNCFLCGASISNVTLSVPSSPQPVGEEVAATSRVWGYCKMAATGGPGIFPVPFQHDISWGDGANDTGFSYSDTAIASHQYGSPGVYGLSVVVSCPCIWPLVSGAASATVSAQCGLQTNRAHEIDGCSIPEQITNTLIASLGGTQQDPFGGDYGIRSTAFGVSQGTVPRNLINTISSLPCNQHDLCYQTCGSARNACDSNFRNNMVAVCNAAYPSICPYTQQYPDWVVRCISFATEKEACPLAAAAVYAGVAAGGNGAFNIRQQQHCSCGTPP